jgi:hypothetical protein
VRLLVLTISEQRIELLRFQLPNDILDAVIVISVVRVEAACSRFSPVALHEKLHVSRCLPFPISGFGSASHVERHRSSG